jgi:CHAT domain-containing protein
MKKTVSKEPKKPKEFVNPQVKMDNNLKWSGLKTPKKHQNGYNKIRNSSKIRVEIETSEVRKIRETLDDGNNKWDAQNINQFQEAQRQHQYGNISPIKSHINTYKTGIYVYKLSVQHMKLSTNYSRKPIP